MTRARASLSPVQFSGSFVRYAWSVRGTLTEEERHGLFQFLYVTACSSIEAILSEYMKAVLHWPTATLHTAKMFPNRSTTFNDGISVSLDQTLMNESVRRLLERTAHELAAAPFARLMDLHLTIFGTKPGKYLALNSTEPFSASLQFGIFLPTHAAFMSTSPLIQQVVDFCSLSRTSTLIR